MMAVSDDNLRFVYICRISRRVDGVFLHHPRVLASVLPKTWALASKRFRGFLKHQVIYDLMLLVNYI